MSIAGISSMDDGSVHVRWSVVAGAEIASSESIGEGSSEAKSEWSASAASAMSAGIVAEVSSVTE